MTSAPNRFFACIYLQPEMFGFCIAKGLPRPIKYLSPTQATSKPIWFWLLYTYKNKVLEKQKRKSGALHTKRQKKGLGKALFPKMNGLME